MNHLTQATFLKGQPIRDYWKVFK